MAAKVVKTANKKEKVGISAPWTLYYRMLEAMFAEDPEVKVVMDDDEPEVKLYVENSDKANALAELLPVEKEFGNVTLKVTVLLPNENAPKKSSLIAKAFEGNPALKYICKAPNGEMSFAGTYVVFKNKVVQYFSDNLADIHGVTSTLYQDLAAELFGADNDIFFCTDVTDENVGKPLGEWP